ncbi:BTAD domain-containing putative transcriptional regulator [Devosia nitrariae]|uniref:Trifolitoxin synthesis, TfuA n=1 Tax=Devosia nitrariae TaxID=2071872 RepID=A0ABQ5W4V2_9HYPH|nr:BTAD domain-containing putative transcriptional regulator [Devosia nitrariae]GLQ55089.1 trifolitoxin synthesis, TfuA [Devosia nitrariae]
MARALAQATESNTASVAHFELFGALRLWINGQPPTIRGRKSRALLAYLALTPQQSASRVRLAGLLWSDKTDSESQVSLRQQLMSLRRDLNGFGQDILKSDRLNIWLDGGSVTSDIGQMLAAISAGDVPEALVDRKGLADEFLSDLDVVDGAFDYWRSIQRESFREQLLTKLSALASGKTSAQRRHQAAIAIRNLDPTNEEACRVLMQYHAALGEIPTALRIYNELWTLLDEEFDLEPAEETQALVARIKLGEAAPIQLPTEAAPGETAPQTGHVLILVEPFGNEDLSEASHRRIAGLRNELIGALTRFRDWSVREAGPGLDEETAAARRAYDIAATGLQEDGELYLSLVVRRHADKTYLWSQQLSVQVEHWAAAKLAIIRRIASSLDVHISAERLARIAALPDQNLDVYDRWLRANGFIFRWQPNDEIRAEAIFRSILVDTQNFAPAYVGLVQILNTRHHIFPGVMRDTERAMEALEFAKTAVRLDPLDCRTQLCLAWSHILNGNYQHALFAYDLALELNQNDPWTLTSCAQGLSYCGEKLRARQIAARALDVAIGGAPIHWCYQMCIRFLEGDYAGAVEASAAAEGTAFFVPAWRAAALAHLRQYDAARASMAEFYQAVSGNWYGQISCTPQAVLDWLCQSFPIRAEADRELLRTGILTAGLLQLT